MEYQCIKTNRLLIFTGPSSWARLIRTRLLNHQVDKTFSRSLGDNPGYIGGSPGDFDIPWRHDPHSCWFKAGVYTGIALMIAAAIAEPFLAPEVEAEIAATRAESTGARAAEGEALAGGRSGFSGSGGGMTSRAARRAAMRDQGVPTSQQPSGQVNSPYGRQYSYETPQTGGGGQTRVVTDDPYSTTHGPHWEAGTAKPGRTDPSGRQKWYNTDPVTGKPKSRVGYRPKR